MPQRVDLKADAGGSLGLWHLGHDAELTPTVAPQPRS